MPASKALRNALRWGREEAGEIADDFLDHKVFTYIETLAELAAEHGYELDADALELSDSILLALRGEAREHAGYVVNTYNDDLDGFLERNAALGRERLLDTYDAWASDRGEARAEIVAITEAYPAAADATLAFYRANADGEIAYDFGGHEGDDDPVCDVCKALVDTSPHPHERVVAIGSPHIGCRQAWHRREGAMRGELTLPTEPAGILGSQALVNREGDHDAAVAAINALAEG